MEQHKASYTHAFRIHKQSIHEDIKLDMDNVSTKQQKRVIWECTLYRNTGGTFDCDQCEYKATIKSHLRVHVCTIEAWGDQIWLWSMWVQSKTKKSTNSAQAMETWFDCDQSEYKANHKDSLRLHKHEAWSMKGSNITVTSVSTKQQLKLIWDCTHYRSMRGSNLIVNNVSTLYQNMKGADFIVINVSTRWHQKVF